MKIAEIVSLLQASPLCHEELLSTQVHSVFAGDMLSDVLALETQPGVLVTGLLNPQVIRTAEMLDTVCVIFVRGKLPSPQILSLAEQSGVCVLSAAQDMFSICGLLYDGGLQSVR